MSPLRLSAVELRDAVRARKLSAVEVATAFSERLTAVDGRVQAFIEHDRAAVLARAAEVDRKLAAGEAAGALAGVPVGIKDLICQRGTLTTCGSRILANFRPPYNAHVIERLLAEGAVPFGRLNMDEFAMGSSCENSAWQRTRNPWDLERVPGGSSGGSAAAVAADECPLTLATDTGGSIRQPAAFCGVTGLKPTYGRVSRYGLIAFASSLDQIGPMSRDARDAALLLDVLAGPDPRDSTCSPETPPGYLAALDQPTDRPLRIGLVKEFFGDGLDPQVESAVREAVKVYEKLGAKVVEVSLPHAKYGIAAYYLVATAEASSNLARYEGVHYGYRAPKYQGMIDMYAASRGEGFGPEVQRRIALGTFALSAGYRDAYYVKALKIRRLIKGDYDRAFEACDVIAGPTTPTAPFKLGEKTDDPLAMYLSDIYTVSTNLAGLPGISIPCGMTTGGLPIGLHLQGTAFGEVDLLRIAHRFQLETDWHSRRPALAA